MAFYECNLKEISTQITPSNSSPVALTANGAVKPTTSGFAIKTYESHTPYATPISVLSGEIVRFVGSGKVVDQIGSVTPDNTSPVSLASGSTVYINADGYAIEDYTVATPSNTSPAVIFGGVPAIPTTSGYAIESYNSITPSNAEPVLILDNEPVIPTTTGYAIENYDSVTPSSTPAYVLSGEIIKVEGNGVIFDEVTNITPSNSNPVDLALDTPLITSTHGYAIADYDIVHPTSDDPDEISAGSIIKIDGNGYVIDEYRSLTPSNHAPESFSSSHMYQPTASGYAIESYDSVTPSSSPTSVSSGDIVKIGGSGVIVDAVPTPTSITPSNANPVTLTSGNVYQTTANGVAVESVTDIALAFDSLTELTAGEIYKPDSNGYATSAVTEKTPTAAGVSFPRGLVNMSWGGWAYSGAVNLKPTSLWTNNSPTSSFAGQTVTLSQDIDNFAYIGIRCKAGTSSSSETNETMFSVADLKKSTSGNSKARLAIGASNSSGTLYVRGIAYSSDTKITFGDAYRLNNNAGTSNGVCIPTSIVGYNISA